MAEFPDCPGCQTFASAGEDILTAAREALEGWLEVHLEEGDLPPVPSVRVHVPKGGRKALIRIDALLAVRLQLRWERQRRGYSQAQLGKLLNVSRQQVALLEAPDGNPTLKTLAKAAAALGLELEVALVPPRAA